MAKRGWVRFKVPISTVPGQIQSAVDMAKTARYGQPDAMASLMRRTLMLTSAPILNSLRRMVPQAASAKSVLQGQAAQAVEQNVSHRGKP